MMSLLHWALAESVGTASAAAAAAASDCLPHASSGDILFSDPSRGNVPIFEAQRRLAKSREWSTPPVSFDDV
jgi:hypothetical protein